MISNFAFTGAQGSICYANHREETKFPERSFALKIDLTAHSFVILEGPLLQLFPPSHKTESMVVFMEWEADVNQKRYFPYFL